MAADACPPAQDWNDGRIPYFTLPPKRDTEVAGSAQLVAEWGADFDAAQAATLAGLTSMDEGEAGGAFFQTDTLGAARVDFDGMEAAEAGGSGSGSEEEEEEDAGGLAGSRGGVGAAGS